MEPVKKCSKVAQVNSIYLKIKTEFYTVNFTAKKTMSSEYHVWVNFLFCYIAMNIKN